MLQVMSYVNAPIHDLLIRIKNAYMARKPLVEGVSFSNFKQQVLELLKQYGFIKNLEIVEEDGKKFINIYLNPVKDSINDIPNVKFYSKPSRAWYVRSKDIHTVAGGKGIGIISTSQGLMAAHVAKQKKIGGELIAEIY
ncbi:30S ribosomal protein S8 [candidate division SR1 bacterium RAAC1_SR1_1]|nr:30S ribosomal protein S8 [candidate division SR1 bacterium RAAC1_SR1_1]